MNWRRGFKRIALAYLAGAAVVLIGAVIWDVSQVDCPTQYHYTADQMRRAAITRQLEAKTEALRGKCDVLSPQAAARRRMELEARDRLGVIDDPFVAATRPLPACPADAMKLDPIPYSDTIAHTYVVPGDEVRACWAEVYNWPRTIWTVSVVVLIPLTLALLAAIGFGLFRLGRWFYQGFKGDADV